ncbi:MAG: M28 family peptidase [Polyangiales bacterium]
MIRMPGHSHAGPLPKLTTEQSELAGALQHDVQVLAGDIGERNTRHYGNLREASGFIERSFEEAGYDATRQVYELQGREYDNLEAEVSARDGDSGIVVVGAHYDSAIGSPGANDNGSGVAALLAIARRLQGSRPRHTLRFVAFTNEEMPHFRQGTMGSLYYARRCKERGERVVAMMSLETMGYYSDRRGSQRYPFPIGLVYPSRGDFIGFVGNVASRELVRDAVGSFRRHVRFPSEGAALPSWVPGVGWSDHASFWDQDYPALMVTDTAPFRYPHYHAPGDTPDKVDYERLARVVGGIEAVVRDLAGT